MKIEMIGIPERLLRRRLKCIYSDSVIFGRLTDDEYDRLQKARILYSGSTGKGVQPELYGGNLVAPYIASFFSEIPKALKVLRWGRPKVSLINGVQWIITRK